MNKRKTHQGQATVEYVLIVAVILAALITAIGTGTFGESITNLFGKISAFLSASVAKICNTVACIPPP